MPFGVNDKKQKRSVTFEGGKKYLADRYLEVYNSNAHRFSEEGITATANGVAVASPDGRAAATNNGPCGTRVSESFKEI